MKNIVYVLVACLIGFIAYVPSQERTFIVTAYCPCELCCEGWADGITASGHVITEGDKIVAAPVRYDFGTVMIIPDYGTATVLDRGVTGNHIDILCKTHREAELWGRRELRVKVK